MRLTLVLVFLLAPGAASLMADVPGAWPEVNLANANVVVDRTEIRLHWAGPPMELRRVYNSRSHADGPIGFGWRLAGSRALAHTAGASALAITEDDGAVSRFALIRGKKGDLPRFEPEACCTGQHVERLPGGQYRRTRPGLVELFDARGRLVDVRDLNELGQKLAYGAHGLDSITDSAGRAFRLVRGADGRVERVTEAFPKLSGSSKRQPRTVSFRYDSRGNLVSVTDAMKVETRYAYDGQHRLTQVTQPTLERAVLTYDEGRDWVTSLAMPGGRKLEYAWAAGSTGHSVRIRDEGGRVTWHRYEGPRLTVTDPEGLVTRQTACPRCGGYFAFENAAGGRTTHEHPFDHTFVNQDPAGGVERVERDPVTQAVVRRVDRAGGVTTHEHDARGNLVRTVDPVQNVSRAERDRRGFVSAVVRADNARVELAAGDLGLPEKIVEPGVGPTGIEYDEAGLPRRITDPTGRAVSVTYNAADQPIAIADSAGPQRDLRYDDLGRVIGEVSGGNHRRITYVYGAPDSGPGEGRLVRVAFGTSAETRFGYDTRGNVTQVVRDGNVYSLRYDRDSRPVALTDPSSATVKLDYDALGDVTRVTDPLGNRTESKYDAAGRLTSRVDAVGRTWSFEYDGEGRVKTLKLPGNREMVAVYDPAGRLLTLRQPAGGSEAYAYSPLGHVAAVTDPAGRKTALTYDQGRATEADDPVLGHVRYGYTADGRLSEVLAASGRKITISYDEKTRTRKVATSSDQVIETKLDWEERRLEEKGPDYHLRWSYYEDGYLRDVTDLSTQRTHRYRYDGLGHRTSWSDPDGRDTAYAYDVGGRLAGIEDRLGPRVTLTYDAAGRRVKRELDLGLVTLYGYDPSGKLTDLTHRWKDKPLARTSLVYGPSGVVAKLTQDERVTPVTVDASDRVTGVAPLATPTLEAGTVKSEVRTGAPAGTRPLSYQYDALTRLVGATLSTGGEVKLGYGPDLRWTGYAGPQESRGLVYETDNIVAERDGSGAVVAEYLLGPGMDEPVAMRRDGKLFALVADHLGSIIKVVDAGGAPVREVSYGLAGDVTFEKGSVPCLFGFTGRPQEPHTGLVNLRLRWLNPRLAQFQTLDPLIPASRFDYAGGNPVTFVDPLGASIDAWMAGEAFAASANLASTGAGPVLLGTAGAASLSAFAAGPRARADPGASPLAPGFHPSFQPDAPALARTLVRTAAGRPIGRSLLDDSPGSGPARTRAPGLTSGTVAELMERAAPVPDRGVSERVLLGASAGALRRGLFPAAGRHVAHRLLDAVFAEGPLNAPPMSVPELVQQALAESLTMRVTPVTPPRTSCERIH